MSANTLSSFQPMFRDVWANEEKLLVPEERILMDKFPFMQGKRHGNLYHQPVVLGLEHGVTFDVGGGLTDFSTSTIATANPGPIATAVQDAQVQAYQMYVQTQVSYTALSRMSNEQSFVQESKFLVENNRRSAILHQELTMLYGQRSIGETSAVSASGTSATLTFTAASWCPALWLAAYGMQVDVYATLASAAKTNTTAACVVGSVDLTNRQVTLTINSGDASGLNALTTSFVFRRNAKTGAAAYSEAPGMDAVMNNAGTLHNISAATYPLWKSLVVSSVGALTLSKVQDYIAQAKSSGLDGDVMLICAPRVWGDLMTDQAGSRSYDESFSSERLENGAKGIRFYSQNGRIEVISHKLCKDGDAFIVPERKFVRLGSSDITFRVPGAEENQFLFPLETKAGFEFRSYTDQTPFCAAPAELVKLEGITISGP